MPSFIVKFQVTHPMETTTVDAPDRDRAIAQVVEQHTAAGDEVQVFDAKELPAPAGGATGGATGLAAA